jgi:hypothetical protein
MSNRAWVILTAAAVVLTAATPLRGAKAQDAPVRVDPKVIWQADLAKLAGRYGFAQVASPGGLWLKEEGKDRQVSIGELPPALRERFENAEIVISDLQLPGTVEAADRESPSKRGRLRFYNESAIGRLSMRGLPGIGGAQQDEGNFAGPVLFQIDHAGHSNPSVSGVLTLRQQQERTWGVATVDYADLSAAALLPNGKPGEDDSPVMMNARILRSGVEIFAYVEWTEAGRRYQGSLRLARRQPTPAPAAPPAAAA